MTHWTSWAKLKVLIEEKKIGSSQWIIVYLDMECENSHFANQQSLDEKMMWFGEFVVHFSREKKSGDLFHSLSALHRFYDNILWLHKKTKRIIQQVF